MTTHPFTQQQSTAARRRGKVIRFFDERGFGFIQPQPITDTLDDTVFVHCSQVVPPQNLRVGALVAFNVEPRIGRPGQQQATRVRILPPASEPSESEPTGLGF